MAVSHFVRSIGVAISCPSVCAQASFDGPRDYVVGSEPESVAIGDFNGDGHPDVAAANFQSNNISILLQNSGGGFKSAVNYAAGSKPMSLRASGYFSRQQQKQRRSTEAR
jgi:FG-GAP-like repeat